ncbi:Krueppel homolog 2 [Daktulosphaira vitifoliae]|uniref:Krueppel homolog 2 n=1 Tax=Daktulosphaira vitifoliae TaxID=58002 RepID=UPI0021AA5FF8|nr:Krueppel homolog 2 [Daktulosphaira vitifoliae]XP_050543946.1 Krueppel homolog 2 [Daktulosphaira vitifoliae]XP_050543947.1 Krueppel homolog 2 [Daktulosphaira vitifoliae]
MAEGDDNDRRPKGIECLKQHIVTHKVEVTLWATRLAAIIFTFAYLVPLFWNPASAYYRILLANAATSALRLHQRLPTMQISVQFLTQLFKEDSCHYLLYSLIFLYVSPNILIILPVFLFSLIHFASYSLTLLDLLGQNSWWGARLLISLVEFQSRSILRLIAFSEILVMPLTLFMSFFGRSGLLTIVFYYHFLTLRYASQRNPHTRLMFGDLRVAAENFANKPTTPSFLQSAILSGIATICRMAPTVPHSQ